MGERLALLVLLVALPACEEPEPTWTLEFVCSQAAPSGTGTPACRVSGDARMTHGLTGDSLAVRLGPQSGALHIRLNAIAAATQPRWTLDILAAARPLRSEGNRLYRAVDWGSCGVECPEQPVDGEAALQEEYRWARMVEDMPGAAGKFVPDDATLTLRGADIDLLDLRTPGFTQPELPF